MMAIDLVSSAAEAAEPFVTVAGAAAPAAGNSLMQLLPFVLIFVIFYFLLIRPQQKRMKEHREMVANLRRGDVVVTNGGLIGKVNKVSDDELSVELADGVRVRIVRTMIAEVRAKTEPASGASNDAEG